MNMSNLKSERRSVYFQFFVFAIAFITRMMYYFAEAAEATGKFVESKYITHFHRSMLESAGFLLVNIIPITYQLIVHYKTYSSETKHSRYSSESSGSKMTTIRLSAHTLITT